MMQATKRRFSTMQFALLIYGDETMELPAEGTKEMMDGYRSFGERNRDAIRGGDALRPTATATTVRVRDGERLLTDGPFAETREHLGGFYLVDVESVDEAVELAAQIPGAATGAVEVRPVMVFETANVRARRGRRPHEPRGRGRRSPVPARVGAGDRDPGPRDARSRPRRGGRPGRVPRGAGAVARGRRAGRPRGVDLRDGPQPGDRRGPARAATDDAHG